MAMLLAIAAQNAGLRAAEITITAVAAGRDVILSMAVRRAEKGHTPLSQRDSTSSQVLRHGD
jgi:hypothetical protein